MPYLSEHLFEEQGLGFDASGIVGAVGGSIANAFNVAGQIEGRRAGQRSLSEERTSAWNERLAEAHHYGELADLEAQLRQEEQQLLHEMEVEAREERLATIRARRREVVAMRLAATEGERRRSMRRLPSWLWPVLGVGLVGGTFAFVAWRALRP